IVESVYKGMEKVGERNLILDSGVPIENSPAYNIVNYNLSTSDLKYGEEITITIKAKLGENREQFGFYNTQGINEALLGFISKGDFDSNGIATKAFRWVEAGRNNRLRVFQFPNNEDLEASSIEWIKLVRGNKSSKDWT